MRRFTITGSFEAENINDAFFRLGLHFMVLALTGSESPAYPFPSPHEFTVEPEAAPATGRAEAS